MSRVINVDEFFPVRTPNKEYVAELVMKIKGNDRSMAEFAEDTGVTTSMLSRIINGAYLKSISVETLAKIMSGARDTCEVTFLELANANGLETKEQMEKRATRENQKRRDRVEYVRNIARCEEIVLNKILSKGYGMKKITRLRGQAANLQTLFPNDIGGDFRIELFGEEKNFFWHFMVNPTAIEEDASAISQAVRIRRMFYHYGSLFLQSEWEPEKFADRKISFVFVDRTYYEGFFELLMNAKIKIDMSVILVDVENGSVIEEASLTEESYGCTNSIFDTSESQAKDNTPFWEDENYGEWNEDSEE